MSDKELTPDQTEARSPAKRSGETYPAFMLRTWGSSGHHGSQERMTIHYAMVAVEEGVGALNRIAASLEKLVSAIEAGSAKGS